MALTFGVRMSLGLFISPINTQTGLGLVAISFAYADVVEIYDNRETRLPVEQLNPLTGTRLWVNAQGSEWCQVTNQANGMTGYVMTAYIQLHNLPSTPWRTVSHPSGSYVNLRSSANMSINNVLSRMPSGASVQVLIPGSEWTKVSYGGTTGYMLTYFLK